MVVLGGLHIVLMAQASSLMAENIELDAELKKKEAIRLEVEEMEKVRKDLEQKLAVIQQLNANRIGPVMLLSDLSDATPEKLQEIGRELLAVRSKINAEITRIIMLKEAKALPQARSSECDCGILKEISDGLQEVQDASKGYQKCTVTLFFPSKRLIISHSQR